MANKKNDPETGDGAGGFSPQQAAEFMQRMWNPFGVPMPGFGAAGAPGTAPGVPHSHTKPFVRSKGRKFERARGRRASRGYRK